MESGKSTSLFLFSICNFHMLINRNFLANVAHRTYRFSCGVHISKECSNCYSTAERVYTYMSKQTVNKVSIVISFTALLLGRLLQVFSIISAKELAVGWTIIFLSCLVFQIIYRITNKK